MSSVCSTSTEEISRQAVIDGIQWDKLLEVGRRIRDGKPATWVSAKFHSSSFHLERVMAFAGGLTLIARVRVPPPESLGGAREMLKAAKCMEIEVASAKFLREYKLAPCQEVHAYNVEAENDVGAPYVIMQVTDGCAANRLRIARNGPDSKLFGTEKQDEKFRKQMAEIQVKLASWTFPYIGCLHWDKDTKKFSINSELRTGQGPWKHSKDYFQAIVDHEMRACAASDSEELWSSPSYSLPVVFERLMSAHPWEPSNGNEQFCLMDRNLGADNLLVDQDFNIIGMLMWDGIMAAPIEQAAQFPRHSYLSRPPLGYLATTKAGIEIDQSKKKRREDYLRLVKVAEKEETHKTSDRISDRMLSIRAKLVEGLVRYGDHKLEVNNGWAGEYSRLLSDNESRRRCQ